MNRGWRWMIGVALILGLPGLGQAAPFCVVDFAGQRCWYADMDSCRRAAGVQGSCMVNPLEMKAPSGGASFCLVESWQTQCIYKDLASCNHQAALRRGACLPNPNQAWIAPWNRQPDRAGAGTADQASEEKQAPTAGQAAEKDKGPAAGQAPAGGVQQARSPAPVAAPPAAAFGPRGWNWGAAGPPPSNPGVSPGGGGWPPRPPAGW
ncbi:MAG: hypothetical protein HQL82_12390 [Magnetococcales bacterium]|nr:hypothetical protein [Magnetococcales bacterium]